MEYRRFYNGLVASANAYSHFTARIATPPKETSFVMDEATSFPPRWPNEKSYTLPPKRRGENREQYRRRLRESGLIG